uniref:FIST C-domain domain-containing protein n=1 Tax=Arion vulgaris TaxID=1028688 RepID=A0A0B6Y7T1_9EUPU
MRPLMAREIKMINLFCPLNGIDQEIGYSLFRIFNWPLVAGGYVNEKHVRVSRGNVRSSVLDIGCIVSGLAICGHNVKVASVLIRSEDVAEVDSTIRALTEHRFPLHNSFGLMYACVGRGAHVYGRQNVESSIFHKYFPNTPLLGFFGNGEVGCKFPLVDPRSVGDTELQSLGGFPKKLTASSDKGQSDTKLKNQLAEMRQKHETYKMKHPPKLLHAYTTVMCLISLP